MGGHSSMDSFHRMLERAQRPIDENVVAGSAKEDAGVHSFIEGTTEQLLAAFRKSKGMTDQKKSPRFSDVPCYTIESLDIDQLRDEVFGPLEFTDGEKQAAGAIVNYPDKTQAELSKQSGQSTTTISRVVAMLECRQDPNETQEEILRYARANPEETYTGVGKALDSSHSYVKFILRAYRHERIDVDGETDAETDSTTDEVDTTDDDKESKSDEATTVQQDLRGDEDLTYKYDVNSTSETRDGRNLKKIATQGELRAILQEHETRLQEVEDREAGMATDELESLRQNVSAVQSVIDRMENGQIEMERVAEEVKEGHDDVTGRLDNVDRVIEQVQERVESVENSLTTHKQAIEDVRERGDAPTTSSFTTEEKRRIIVALANNGNDDLIDKVIEEL